MKVNIADIDFINLSQFLYKNFGNVLASLEEEIMDSICQYLKLEVRYPPIYENEMIAMEVIRTLESIGVLNYIRVDFYPDRKIQVLRKC